MSDTDVGYVDAEGVVARSTTLVCKSVGNKREGQIGFTIALITVAGNILAQLTSHERAAEHLRKRFRYHEDRIRKHRIGGTRR